MSEIRFENVSVLYEGRKKDFITALDNVSFSMKDGLFHVIVGPSGCGKTSLMKCITGDVIYEGKVYLNYKDIEEIAIKDRKLSYMSQDYIVFPNINVYDNIAFPLRVMKMDHDLADQKIKDIAHILDIDYLLTRKTKYLSIGQVSRVALAKSLIKDSDVFLFDEPIRNLDSRNRDIVLGLIKTNIKQKKKTTVYITHDIQEALLLADLIHVFDQGHYIGTFTPQEFLKNNNEVVESLKADLKHEEKES